MIYKTSSLKFFSGFCLKGEEELFSDYLIDNDFTVSGFSYGAIKAFEYVLNSKKRVDTLQLFSPAFFQTKDEKFKRMQIMYFKKDEKTYCKNFLENSVYPYKLEKNNTFNMSNYFTKGTLEELEKLLNYTWDEYRINCVLKKGTKIEVYLGEKDKIIDSKAAVEFFRNFSTVYFIKEKGHIL